VGWCSLGKSHDADAAPDTGELLAIYVAREHWGTGAGRALWLEARRLLVDEGFREVTVWVLRDNARTIRFYELAGFVLEPGSEKLIDIGGYWLPEVRLRCRLESR